MPELFCSIRKGEDASKDTIQPDMHNGDDARTSHTMQAARPNECVYVCVCVCVVMC